MMPLTMANVGEPVTVRGLAKKKRLGSFWKVWASRLVELSQ